MAVVTAKASFEWRAYELFSAPVNRQVYAITIFITTVSLNALVLSTVDRRLRLVTSESFRFRYFLGQPGPVAIR